MRSPLEHDPELIHGLGLICARWATLENELAVLLGRFTIDPDTGVAMYYSAGNFQQRINIIERTLQTSIRKAQHREVCAALTERIRRIWKKRNRLVHSRYVYRITDDMGWTDLSVEGPNLRKNIHESRPPTLTVGSGDTARTYVPTVESRGFGYILYGPNTPMGEFKSVNLGTYESHAGAVSTRARQVARLNKAIQRGRVPVRSVQRASS